MIKVNIQGGQDSPVSLSVDQVERGDVVIVCRHNRPVAELRAVEKSLVPASRVAGLLKGQVDWKPGAFDPMTDEELAEFDGAPLFPHPGPA